LLLFRLDDFIDDIRRQRDVALLHVRTSWYSHGMTFEGDYKH